MNDNPEDGSTPDQTVSSAEVVYTEAALDNAHSRVADGLSQMGVSAPEGSTKSAIDHSPQSTIEALLKMPQHQIGEVETSDQALNEEEKSDLLGSMGDAVDAVGEAAGDFKTGVIGVKIGEMPSGEALQVLSERAQKMGQQPTEE